MVAGGEGLAGGGGMKWVKGVEGAGMRQSREERHSPGTWSVACRSTRCTVTGGGHTRGEQSLSVYKTLRCTPETKVMLCVKYTAIK